MRAAIRLMLASLLEFFNCSNPERVTLPANCFQSKVAESNTSLGVISRQFCYRGVFNCRFYLFPDSSDYIFIPVGCSALLSLHRPFRAVCVSRCTFRLLLTGFAQDCPEGCSLNSRSFIKRLTPLERPNEPHIPNTIPMFRSRRTQALLRSRDRHQQI